MPSRAELVLHTIQFCIELFMSAIDKVLPREIFSFWEVQLRQRVDVCKSDICSRHFIQGVNIRQEKSKVVNPTNRKRQESTLNHFLQKGKCLLEIQFYKRQCLF